MKLMWRVRKPDVVAAEPEPASDEADLVKLAYSIPPDGMITLRVNCPVAGLCVPADQDP